MTKFKFEVGDAVHEPNRYTDHEIVRMTGPVPRAVAYLLFDGKGTASIKFDTLGLIVRQFSAAEESNELSGPGWGSAGYYILFGEILVRCGQHYADENLVKVNHGNA
jgi:hypothetical protein